MSEIDIQRLKRSALLLQTKGFGGFAPVDEKGFVDVAALKTCSS